MGTLSRPHIRLAILALAAAMAPAIHAEISMSSVAVCSQGWDILDPKYTNQTPDPWNLRGYRMRVGDQSVSGWFITGGNSILAPGQTAAHTSPSCGHAGPVTHRQAEVKIGSCNEPDPFPVPPSLSCTELSGSGFDRDPNRCLTDGVGTGNGAGFGGFLDSWRGQSQIQVAIPPADIQFQGSAVRFDPASMGGPLYMMSLAALQEYLQVDMQVLLAFAATRSKAALVDAASGASLYDSPANTGNDASQYGSFKVNYLVAAGRLYNDYPRYFPGKPPLANLVATGGSGATAANSVQHVNSGVLAALGLWWLHDGLSSSLNLCYRQFLRDAADRTAGLKLLLSGYHIGHNAVDNGTGPRNYATQILPASEVVKAAADITPLTKKNPWAPSAPHDHITDVMAILNPLLAAGANSAACGKTAAIYDAGITRQQVQELFFGQGGSATTQGHGGFLWHTSLAASSRIALWTDLNCAFDALKGKSPGRSSDEISFRYDFLSILRVAKPHLSGYADKTAYKPNPADAFSSEYTLWVYAHSNSPCAGMVVDEEAPRLTLAGDALRAGDKVESSAADNRGIRTREYTTDLSWRSWQAANANLVVPAGLAESARLWYRVADSCGNAVIEEVPLSTGPVKVGPSPSRPVRRPAGKRGSVLADGRRFSPLPNGSARNAVLPGKPGRD